MSFVDQDPNKNFPVNPSTFQPFGTKFFNEETKLLNETLEAILTALQGGTTGTPGVDNAEQLTLGTAVQEDPTFTPSYFTIVNPAANNGDIEFSLTTRAGDKSFIISPGETFSPPYIPGLTYDVSAIINGGDTEAEYFGVLIGLA